MFLRDALDISASITKSNATSYWVLRNIRSHEENPSSKWEIVHVSGIGVWVNGSVLKCGPSHCFLSEYPFCF